MKLRKFMVANAAFVMILGLLVVVPVHAQVGFVDWQGMWLKGAVKEKGVNVVDSGTETEVEKLPTYGFVQDWDDNNKQFTSWLIQQDTTGDWMDAMPFIVQVINGNPLDYVSYAFIPPAVPPIAPPIEILALIINATGKESKGVLKGKVRTVGGCVLYNFGGGSYFAANESLNMKMVPAEKVPQDVKDKLEEFCPGGCPPIP
jgi:hypothetical protein